AGEKKILIDCGSIKSGGHDMKTIVGAVIAHLKEDGERPHVDLLVVTHRHRDHISGFADPRWREVTVGEVWMPWMEKPGDAKAEGLRLAQMRFAAAVGNAIAAARRVADRSALLEIVLNAQSNDDALDMLHRGFAGRPPRRYLPEEGRELAVLQAAV